MNIIKKHSDNHISFNGKLFPKTIIVEEFNGKVDFYNNNDNTDLLFFSSIISIEADGKTINDFSSKKEFLNFISELVFKKGGAGSESGANYTPNVIITETLPTLVTTSKTSQIMVKGMFTDYVNDVTVTALDNTDVAVAIVSKTFNELILNLTANAVVQKYTITLTYPNGANTFEVDAQDVVIIIPDASVWENKSPTVNVGPGFIETNTPVTGWSKQATFGSIPAGKNGSVFFKWEGFGANSNGTSSYFMAGVGIDPEVSASYTTIDHAIYISNGTALLVYENGSGRNIGTAKVGDEFEIRRTNGVITYYKNGVLFYTSTIASTGALHFDCSLYRNIKLSNIKIVY